MTTTGHTSDALRRVESKLIRLQAQVADMQANGTDAHYIVGWVEGSIKAALIEIDVWS
jgi:hypothetical protein